jgi:hypothetical protein
MKTKNKPSFYKCWVVGHKVRVSHHKFVIFMQYNPICEERATLQLCNGISLLHHMYIPILGPHARDGGFPNLPCTILGDNMFHGFPVVYP